MLKVGLHLPETEREVRWRELADICRTAERVGFDSIWIPDHLLYRFPGEEPKGPWECWSILSAVAAVTERVEFGPLVLCTNFRNPGVIAKMAATVEEISGGRLILGLGAGWHQPEYDAFGFDYEHRFGRFVEAFTIIRTLLRERRIDFQGKYYTLRDCEIRPFGPRPEGPPLMIGSRGPQMLAATLPHLSVWNGWYAWTGNTAEGYRPLREEIDIAARNAGRAPEEIERTMAILLRFPEENGPVDPRATVIQGDVDVLARGVLELAAEGVSHIQVVLEPCTPQSVERFGRALERIRAGVAS
ncbi:MAG: LLM class flavin-dependent oxidoreductase [Chloroflexota bacterium]|jgi:alkanesulfonate monooxygenase SsuD/methylene tetrahydromethanopterin reductase-like flavin-dependent oxidoreductase (luciferase family)|nr:LLM class flavin-dependent oxidoreductase [Chloroflexota bacterium]